MGKPGKWWLETDKERQIRQAAQIMPLDQLDALIEEGFTRIAELRELDEAFGGFSRERFTIMDETVPRVVVREERRRELKRLEQLAARQPAEVTRRSALNEFGRYQSCVVAICGKTGDSAQAWGTSDRSVARALFTLSEACSCGAERHRMMVEEAA